jgi:coenzyme PQQ biosynthesis protein PqqD
VNGSTVVGLARGARVRFDRTRQKHVLLLPERGYVLNESAACIVRACEYPRSVDTLIEEVQSRYAAVPRHDLERSVHELVDALLIDGALRVEP